MVKNKDYYNDFKGFINAFIVKHKSFVLIDEITFDADEQKVILSRLYERFVKSLRDNEKDSKFDDVVKNVDRYELIMLNHAVWLWGYPNNRKPKWVTAKGVEMKFKDMSSDSVAGAGSGYVQYKTKGIRFILYIFLQILDAGSTENAIDRIIKICQGEQDKNDVLYQYCLSNEKKEDMPDGVRNLLLHLCAPDRFEPIASTNDKQKIVKNFIDNSDANNIDIDTTIAKIRKNIKLGSSKSFYDDNLPLLWKGDGNGSGLSRVQLLEYKKAMVLYGPPGTGKTYTANELAKELLIRNAFREKELSKIDLTQITNENYENNIYSFQFHINYNYEDFIAGQVIDQNGGVVTKKGAIFDIIDKAKNANNNEPFIVILDEMNRVDVSRVFGELFSAIENRGKDINLILSDPDNKDKRLVLNVPDNIYFIGTMNEIDFSLEQIDFALRRRFIWELADYDEDALEDIIKINYAVPDCPDQSDFLDCCSNLNRVIEENLGKEYHIGHAFFAEIGKIAANLQTNNIPGNIWRKAKNILWEISVKPTLDAYCGTMDKEDKKKFLKSCDKAYKGKNEQTSDTED